MVMALTKIARIYSRNSNVVTSINFNSSSDLINEIDSGEPADVFISGHTGWIEMLKQKGLVDVYNIGYIASDSLVLITSQSNNNLPIELQNSKISLEDALNILNKNRSTLIIDNQGFTSGKYSSELVKNLQLPKIKLFNKIAEDRTPILSIIKNNPKDYAILLSSQIKDKSYLKTLAVKKESKIFYQALVIAGDNMEVAREFLKFLKTPKAKAILHNQGFIVE